MLLLWPLLLLINIVLADVSIVSPSKSNTFSPTNGKVTIDLKWKDNGAPPEIKQIKWYSISLQTGPNNNMHRVMYFKNEMSSSDVKEEDGTYSMKVEIDEDQTGDGQYFIQVYSAITEDASSNTLNYTPRFYLKNMKGSKHATYSGSSQPPDITDYTTSVPYTRQTGVTRTAPMQMQPSAKVTMTSWSMQFPTSAVTFFTKLSPSPQCITTLTPGWSYSMTSVLNHATPAPQPSKNGGWYNPKKRQSLSTRKMNLKNLLTQSISK